MSEAFHTLINQIKYEPDPTYKIPLCQKAEGGLIFIQLRFSSRHGNLIAESLAGSEPQIWSGHPMYR